MGLLNEQGYSNIAKDGYNTCIKCLLSMCCKNSTLQEIHVCEL